MTGSEEAFGCKEDGDVDGDGDGEVTVITAEVLKAGQRKVRKMLLTMKCCLGVAATAADSTTATT